MKRNLIIATSVAFALALPAVAPGQVARSVYKGHLLGSPDAPVKLKEKFGDLERSVTLFSVRNFGVECDGGIPGTLKRTKLVGAITVDKSGEFNAKDDNGKTVFKVRGHIGRNKAFGNFRYSGQIRSDDGSTRDCDSGKLAWVARL